MEKHRHIILQIFIFATTFCCITPTMAQNATWSQETDGDYLPEWEEVENNINKGLQEINRQTERSINCLQNWAKNFKAPVTRPASRKTQTANRSTRKQQELNRQAQQKARHQQWLKEKCARDAEERERNREYERQWQEQERRRQEKVRQRVTAETYIREGIRTENNINAARWRTGEGARIMDQRHRAQNLMRTDRESHFTSHGVAEPGKHKLKTFRSTEVLAINPNANRLATTPSDAISYDKRTDKLPAVSVDLRPVSFAPIPGSWQELEQKWSPDRVNTILVLLHFCNNGKIPELTYSKKKDAYYFATTVENDKDKGNQQVVVVSGDGGSMKILTIETKDFSVQQIIDNIENITVSASLGSSSLSANAKLKPLKEEDGSLIDQTETNLNTKLWSSESNNNNEPKDASNDSKDNEKGKNFPIGISAKVNVVQDYSKIKYQYFNINNILSKEVAFGMSIYGKAGWHDNKIKASADIRKGLKAEFSASPIEAGGSGMVVFKGPSDIYCFNEVEGSLAIGAKAGVSSLTGLTALPAWASANVKSFKCVSAKTVRPKMYNTF